MSDDNFNNLYDGLQILAKTAFPKRCRNCKRVYHDAEAFLAETKWVKNNNESSLKTEQNDGGAATVELFRNCPCGSTLMNVFNNRRDVSENGIKRRNNFDKLIHLTQRQYTVDHHTAREELLKIMSGENSDIINDIIPSPE